MALTKSQNWRTVKAKLILRYGGVSAAANALGCSTEAIRLTAKGRCPKVAARLRVALASKS